MAASKTKSSTKQDPKTGRFVTGNNGGGRPKGSRNKLSEAFLSALANDFAEHGPAVVEQVRTERPQDYLKTIASVLPRILDAHLEADFVNPGAIPRPDNYEDWLKYVGSAARAADAGHSNGKVR